MRKSHTFAAGASLLAVTLPGTAHGQSLPPIVDPGPPVADTPPSCGASRRDPLGGNFCVGATTVTNTFTDSLTFLPPTVTTEQQQEFDTRLIARLEGGVPLFDETFLVPFTNPAVQDGVARARAAITSAGGPGIIILGPALINRTTSTRTVTGSSVYTLAGFNEQVGTTTTIGGVTGPLVDYPGTIFSTASIIAIGDRTSCASEIGPLIAGGTSEVRPTCGPVPEGDIRGVPGGSTNVDNEITTEFLIAETRTDIVIETISETYELTGQVVPVGTVHAAVQSGLYDLAGRLLRRLPELERGLSGEHYVMHVRQGDTRDVWGLGGGYAFAAAPGLTLGFALDHGWTDIDVPGALESAEIELTELGATAQLVRGPLLVALSGVYGFGSADTLRSIFGSSAADYDVRVAGGAVDVGYSFDAGSVHVTPVASLDYVAIHSNGFTEIDALGLVAHGNNADRLRGSAGIELGAQPGEIRLSAAARYVALLDGEQRTLPITFTAVPGAPLTMRGIDEPDTLQLGATARVPLGASAALTLGYDGRLGEGYTQHAAFAAINLSW